LCEEVYFMGIKIKTEVVYDGWMKLIRKQVNEKWYEVLENHDAVSAIVKDKNGKILLVEQYRPAMDVNTLEIPAGVIDKPLTNEEIMAEELAEEANLQVDAACIKEAVCFKPIVGFSNSTTWIYEVQLNVEGENMEIHNDDVHQIHWYTLDEFRSGVNTGAIDDCKTIIAFYYLESQYYKNLYKGE